MVCKGVLRVEGQGEVRVLGIDYVSNQLNIYQTQIHDSICQRV